MAAIEAAAPDPDNAEAEELALRFAGAAVAALAGRGRIDSKPSRRDERRIADAVRRIETAVSDVPDAAHQRLSLAALASDAAMSPYHFLRTFRRVIGMTRTSISCTRACIAPPSACDSRTGPLRRSPSMLVSMIFRPSTAAFAG